MTKEALGSVHYISPEQAKGGNVDNRSDLYSLGVVMYEMMTGRPPYDGETPVSVAIQHINGKPQMPSTLNPNIPGGLEQIIMKVMDQEPDKRYDSAQAMLYDLDEFRKDPSILFDYHNTSAELDDVIRMQSPAEPAVVQQKPVTTAERPARESTAHKTAVKTAARKPGTAVRSRRRPEEIIEDEERGGKAATISIIVCSVVAVIAIVVFLVALLGNNGLKDAQNTVTVPNLLNATLDEAAKATDYIVEVEKWVYSSEYEKGKIIEQNPKAHTQVNKGSTVTVVVSNGPEPKEKLMEDLLGLDATTAKNYLINTQGIPESNISVIYSNSDDVPVGQIFKTEPAKDGELTEQTLIKLHISTGPEVKTVTMVDFTSGGYTRESAEKWLQLNGFQNVEVYEEVSDQPQGKIFYQNIPSGRTINVTTTIILRVSKGKDTTITLPPDELPEPEDYIYQVIPVPLPTDKQEEYTVSLYREGVLIEERVIPAGTVSTEFRVSGKDTMKFSVLIDNEPYTTMNVTFVEEAE